MVIIHVHQELLAHQRQGEGMQLRIIYSKMLAVTKSRGGFPLVGGLPLAGDFLWRLIPFPKLRHVRVAFHRLYLWGVACLPTFGGAISP